MGTYRNYRNCEASIIDFITAQLVADGWTGIRVEKTFAEVYKGQPPCICINVDDSDVFRRELGSDSYLEDITISFRLFCVNDGQRLDLASWFLEKVMPGINYYEYVIINGAVSSKTLKGKIICLKITRNRKELINTENLVKEDRYRHIIMITGRVALS